jgi:superfamily II DNA helicase RecQ
MESYKRMDASNLLACLQLYFSYSKFRPYQLECMLNLCNGHDVFAMMSTGAGKSLIYQLPSVTYRHYGVLTTQIVISPLLSLIEDQGKTRLSMFTVLYLSYPFCCLMTIMNNRL